MKVGLFTVGVGIMVVGVALVAYGSLGQANASTGGFILVGPFPVVFGTGGNGGELAILSVVLGVIMLVLVALRVWCLRPGPG